MANLTVSVDTSMMQQIKAHPEINWSEAAREGLRRRLRELHVWDELLAASKLSEEDVAAVADEIDAAMAERLRRLAR